MRYLLAIFLTGSTLLACSQNASNRVVLGNEKLEEYLPYLEEKRVAVVGNHTSVIKADIDDTHTHLVDTLLSLEVDIVKAFAPEHGFRGKRANGEHIVERTNNS